MVDGHRSLEGSIAPTPATSPERGGSPSKASHDDQDDEGSVINQQPSVEEDGIVEKVDQMALSEAPDQSPGKTNQWSESVTRSPGSVGDRVLSPKNSTMAGVLREDESVHGHLKFHHHALW